jgi:hypothetical protein
LNANGAPFSADATTTVNATLGDGTRLDRSTTYRYFRYSAGRARVERPPPAYLFETPPDYTMDFSSTPNDPLMSFTAPENRRAGAFRAGRER